MAASEVTEPAFGSKCSIVICTRNREHSLVETLEALERSASEGMLPVLEILVVNNGEPFEVELLKVFPRLPLRLIREPRGGRSTALNTATRCAKGDWLLLTDDDATPSPTWAQAYHDAILLAPLSGYMFGPISPSFSRRPPPWWMDLAPASHRGRHLGSRPREYSTVKPDSDLIGVNAAVRRSLAAEFTFDEAIGAGAKWSPVGEDVSMGRSILAARHTAHYVPGAAVTHRIDARRFRFWYLVKRKRSVGRAWPLYDRHLSRSRSQVIAFVLKETAKRILNIRRPFLTRKLILESARLVGALEAISVAETHRPG